MYKKVLVARFAVAQAALPKAPGTDLAIPGASLFLIFRFESQPTRSYLSAMAAWAAAKRAMGTLNGEQDT